MKKEPAHSESLAASPIEKLEAGHDGTVAGVSSSRLTEGMEGDAASALLETLEVLSEGGTMTDAVAKKDPEYKTKSADEQKELFAAFRDRVTPLLEDGTIERQLNQLTDEELRALQAKASPKSTSPNTLVNRVLAVVEKIKKDRGIEPTLMDAPPKPKPKEKSMGRQEKTPASPLGNRLYAFFYMLEHNMPVALLPKTDVDKLKRDKKRNNLTPDEFKVLTDILTKFRSIALKKAIDTKIKNGAMDEFLDALPDEALSQIKISDELIDPMEGWVTKLNLRERIEKAQEALEGKTPEDIAAAREEFAARVEEETAEEMAVEEEAESEAVGRKRQLILEELQRLSADIANIQRMAKQSAETVQKLIEKLSR